MPPFDPAQLEVADLLETLRSAAEEWPTEVPADDDLPAHAETAWAIVGNSALLHRITVDDRYLEHWLSSELAERRALILAACGQVDASGEIAHLQALAQQSDLEDADLEWIASRLLLRDEWGLGLDFLDHLASDLTPDPNSPDIRVIRELARAKAQLELLDEAFLENRAATLSALPIFDGMRETFATPPAPHHWWLADGPAVLEAEDKAFMAAHFPDPAANTPDIVNIIEARLRFRQAPQAHQQTAAANTGTHRFERRLLGVEPRCYLAISADGERYRCEILDMTGRAPDWAARAELHVESMESSLAGWRFNEAGHLHIDNFPNGEDRRLVVRDVEGNELGAIALDD